MTTTPTPVSIDIEDLTWDEMEQLEELIQADLGLSFEEAFAPGQKRTRVLKYVALVKLRNAGRPDLTIADIGKMSMKNFAMGEG